MPAWPESQLAHTLLSATCNSLLHHDTICTGKPFDTVECNVLKSQPLHNHCVLAASSDCKHVQCLQCSTHLQCSTQGENRCETGRRGPLCSGRRHPGRGAWQAGSICVCSRPLCSGTFAHKQPYPLFTGLLEPYGWVDCGAGHVSHAAPPLCNHHPATPPSRENATRCKTSARVGAYCTGSGQA